MGGPMAANLVKAGYATRGFDLSPALCRAVESQGVTIAASAEAALSGADALVTMLPAGHEVIAVWSQLLPRAAKDCLFIDCSTIDMHSAHQAHRLARDTGVQAVDAPVSGGVAGARTATLTFMCGGDAPAVLKARPILAAMGRKIVHCGGPSLGQAAKICNNMMLGVTMIATAEAFVLGEKLGLSHQALFDAASVSSGQSWSLTSYCPVPGLTPASPANNDYAPGFMAALMLKDLRLAQQAAMDANAATPLAAAAAQIYALYNSAGEGRRDFSGVINMIRGASA
jgi:3-hydroxyisobutyrate dehydrogenase